ncbi:MAG: YdcF family protein [Deltaproteobacteria bacterium]|nr:YdcF family protein [Deltaproteobacteria bacterium]
MRRRRLLLALLLLLPLADLIATLLYLRHVEAAQAAGAPPARADAAVVFFGDSIDEHTLNEDTRQRVDHAASLYREGRVGEVICVGGNLPWLDFAGSELMKARLIEQGVPAERISLEHDSRDTLGNLEAAAAQLHARGRRSAILVSTRLHLYRIARWNELEGLRFFASASDPADAGLLERWWPVHHEWAAFTLRTLFSEEGYQRVTELARRLDL